jgi:hypothetical protein
VGPWLANEHPTIFRLSLCKSKLVSEIDEPQRQVSVDRFENRLSDKDIPVVCVATTDSISLIFSSVDAKTNASCNKNSLQFLQYSRKFTRKYVNITLHSHY